MKKIISFISAVLMTLSFACIDAYASGYVDIVITEEEMTADAYTAVEEALKTAKKNATENLIYRIYLPSGTYTLSSGLHIYSNTQLYLNADTTLKKGFESGNMIKAGIKSEYTQGYSGYENIVIDGGIWDADFVSKACGMRFAHCTNLTISNLTITNIIDSHHMEVAAVDGLYITNCTFSNLKRTDTSSTNEAVQIDIIHEYDHFPDYYEYDDTPCKNVYVTGCTFTDLYSGIGTRSGVIGSYFDNINITNNTFNNITERAITCFNYINSNISNNTIYNATAGIIFEYLPMSSISSRMFVANGTQGSVIQNASSEISGNVITVSQLTTSGQCCGIYAYGGVINSNEASKYGVTQGDYLIKNIGITGNSIYCYSPAARGISVTGVSSSDITSNILIDYSTANDGINGINLCNSSKNTVKSNIISSAYNNGISLYDNSDGSSKGNNIANNTISNVQSYGVRISGDSYASIKNTNSFVSCGKSALCIISKNYSQNLSGVTIKSITKSSALKPILKWKSVDGADGYKIYRSYTENGTYRQIATVKDGRLMYEDKSARSGTTYYYKISAYYRVSSSKVICKTGSAKSFSL